MHCTLPVSSQCLGEWLLSQSVLLYLQQKKMLSYPSCQHLVKIHTLSSSYHPLIEEVSESNYVCNLSIALQPLQYGAFSKNYCEIHFEITSGKLWTPTMQMRFSRQITLGLSPIPFINVMISKTLFNLFSIAINIILFPVSLFGFWVSFFPLHSSLLDNSWRMKIRRRLHKVIVCPNILSLVTYRMLIIYVDVFIKFTTIHPSK